MKGFLSLMIVIAGLASAYGIMTVMRSSALLSTREGKTAASLVFVGIAMSWGALLAIYAVLSLAT
jgi:hypothetical protein